MLVTACLHQKNSYHHLTVKVRAFSLRVLCLSASVFPATLQVVENAKNRSCGIKERMRDKKSRHRGILLPLQWGFSYALIM
jgi:hypothetical protein